MCVRGASFVMVCVLLAVYHVLVGGRAHIRRPPTRPPAVMQVVACDMLWTLGSVRN